MVTRQEVATRAGVSPSTVSYVLSGKRPTSESTRRKVLAAVEELGYVPNATASALAAREARTIALHLYPDVYGIDSISVDYIVGMRQRVQELGANLLIPFIDSSGRDEFVRFLRSGVADALILMDVATGDWREMAALSESMPTVLLGSTGRQGTRLPFVESDFAQIGSTAVHFSVQRGHRRLLLLRRVLPDPEGHINRTGQAMMVGARMAAHRTRTRLETLELPTLSKYASRVADRLCAPDGPTVVLCENGELASVVAAVANERGMVLGQHYSAMVLGGEARQHPNLEPQFTEIATDRSAMGRMCVDKAVAAARDGLASVTSKMFPPVLIDRGTVCPPPVLH
ncbi:MAG: LacI family DNA-binding transcriptional regulator [Actinomycetaceae bacterium]|nr:LacI family DNA-binding transcriptional regulator [Actinomycetaceae bacterium]